MLVQSTEKRAAKLMTYDPDIFLLDFEKNFDSFYGRILSISVLP